MQISVEPVEAGSSDPARFRTVAVLLLLLAVAVPAQAQQAPPRPGQVRAGPPRLETGFGFRVFVTFDRVDLAAAETFEAVTGSSSLTATGGGGDVRFWRGLFGRFAVSKMEADGTRGFVVQGQFISNGIPLEIEMTPIEIGAGWRQPFSPSRRVVAYGGGGLLRLLYRQSSDFAQPGEDIDESQSGYFAFGGLELGLTRWLMAGVEAQYRTVPDAFGTDSIAAAFEDTDLGGTALRMLVGIRR
jgi:opacity protein-like surface antigen